jgi:hypothetical protein
VLKTVIENMNNIGPLACQSYLPLFHKLKSKLNILEKVSVQKISLCIFTGAAFK